MLNQHFCLMDPGHISVLIQYNFAVCEVTVAFRYAGISDMTCWMFADLQASHVPQNMQQSLSMLLTRSSYLYIWTLWGVCAKLLLLLSKLYYIAQGGY